VVTLEKRKVLSRRKNKLMVKGNSCKKVVKKVEAKAHNIDFLSNMKVFDTFNVGDLALYIEDEVDYNDLLRKNPS